MIENATDETLEEELIALMRRSALTARALALAETMLDAADKRHEEVMARYEVVKGTLEQRYYARAQSAGVPSGTEIETVNVVTLA